MFDKKVLTFILLRMAEVVLLLFIVYTLLFIHYRIVPEDPAGLFINPRMTPETQAALRELWGMDRSLGEQYVVYMQNLLRRDLGISFYYSEDVIDIVAGRFLPAIVLTGVAVVLAVLIDVIAERSGKSAAAGILFYLIPFLWLGFLLLYVFFYRFELFPAGGWGTPELQKMNPSILARVVDTAYHLFLPCTVMVIWTFLSVLVVKTNIRGMIREKKALIPPIMATALTAALIFYGAKVTETLFSWPGFHRTILQGALNYDYPLYHGAVIAAVELNLVIILCVEILYTVLEQRAVTSTSS